MLEQEFQQTVIEAAEVHGWLYYHTHRSDRSPAGFPDLILVRGAVMICLELKSDSKSAKESDAQKEWIRRLKGVKIVTADFAYPRHLDQILNKLSARAK